jgi:predicted CopG family antitoxin
MKTLVLSDAAYNELCSRRIGRESFSKTILRELRPAEKCEIREELERLRREPRYSAEEAEKILGT